MSGIILSKHFNFDFPTTRYAISKTKKSEHHIFQCENLCASLNFNQENEQNMRRIAEIMEVEICIRRGQDVQRYGEGMYNFINI